MKTAIFTRLSFVVIALIVSLQVNAEDPAKDYSEQAQKIAEGLSDRDATDFVNTIAAEQLLDRVFDGLMVESEWENGFREGVSKAIKTRLGERILGQMADGDYAKLLRVKLQGDEGRALMRMGYGDMGNGYIDMHMVCADDGAIRIIDWFDYSTGQLYSESLRQVVATMSPTPTLLGKVYDIATNKGDNAKVLNTLTTMNREGRYVEMVRYFLSLDETYRESRLLNVIAFQAANASNDMEIYHQALANIARYFGDDEAMTFILVDYYFLEEDYNKAIESVELLQASFGVEDAALDTIKANSLTELGKVDKAIEVARHAIKVEPEYENAYWALLSAQLVAEKFHAAVVTAEALEDRFRYDMGPDSVGGDELFDAFIASAPYREWRAGKKY